MVVLCELFTVDLVLLHPELGVRSKNRLIYEIFPVKMVSEER